MHDASCARQEGCARDQRGEQAARDEGPKEGKNKGRRKDEKERRRSLGQNSRLPLRGNHEKTESRKEKVLWKTKEDSPQESDLS